MSKKDEIIANKEREIEILTETIRGLNNASHDLIDELQISRRDLKALKTDYDTQYVRNCELQDQIKKFESTVNELDGQYLDLQEQMRLLSVNLESKNLDMADRIKISDEVIAELRAEHSRLEKEATTWRERFEAQEHLAKQSAALAESRLKIIKQLQAEKDEHLKKLGEIADGLKKPNSQVRIKRFPQPDGTYLHRVERKAKGLFADYWLFVGEYHNESQAERVAKRVYEQINIPITRYLSGTSD